MSSREIAGLRSIKVEKTVSCIWKAKKSAEYWTDVYFIADPDKAIKEGIENPAHHEARASIIVKK